MSEILKEFVKSEFHAFGNFNQNWAPGQQNPGFRLGTPSIKNLLTLKTNPLITQRRIYGYLWARILADPAANFCGLSCEINFSLNGQSLLTLPFCYTEGAYSTPLNLQINGKGPINNSFLTAPIAGGIAEGSVLSLTLADPDGGAFNSETSPLLLQPYDLDIQCDTINLNLLGWINMLPDQSRFFLACVGL